MDAVVLQDEATCQTFPGYVMALSVSDPVGFRALIDARAFLFVTAPVDVVVDQFLARQAEGATRHWDVLSRSELHAATAEEMLLRERWADLLTSVGAPVGQVHERMSPEAKVAELMRLVDALGGRTSPRDIHPGRLGRVRRLVRRALGG